MRRHANERQLTPKFHFLLRDGCALAYEMRLEGDVIARTVDDGMIEEAIDLSDFAHALKGLGTSEMDFTERTRLFLKRNDIGEAVRKKVLEALDDARE